MLHFHIDRNNAFAERITINVESAGTSKSSDISIDLKEQMDPSTISPGSIREIILPEVIPTDVTPRKRITPRKQLASTKGVQDGMYTYFLYVSLFCYC